MPSENESTVIREFLEKHFGLGYAPAKVSPRERAVIDGVRDFVAAKFGRSRYQLGLALDMALLAQQLSLNDPEAKQFRSGLTLENLFARYTRVTARGGVDANTLTLTFSGREIGIRRLEEEVGELFIQLNRPGYPSAYVYNTGQWHKYQVTLLVPCFRLSEAGRFALCSDLIQFGLDNLPPSHLLGRDKSRVRLFETILRDYPRAHKGERAGSVFQGIAAGYMKADRPHLDLIVDKTRTGSAKQNRIGDIDGYYGLDLEVTAEVKDHTLAATDVESELGEFLLRVGQNRVMGLVFTRSIDDGAANAIRSHRVGWFTLESLLAAVEKWDWRKQDAAVHGLLHFLAHIEQNPAAVTRLLDFIRRHDPGHESLAFYPASAEQAPPA